MNKEIYGEDGKCFNCRGTNVCPKCKGSTQVFSEFMKCNVACPLCFGGGDCKFCCGKGRKSTSIFS